MYLEVLDFEFQATEGTNPRRPIFFDKSFEIYMIIKNFGSQGAS